MERSPHSSTNFRGETHFLIFEKPFANFILEAEFYLVAGRGNSGIQYRSKQSERGANKWVVKGYQADIARGWYGKLFEEGGRGGLATRYKEKPPQIKGDDQWNRYRITARGSSLKHEINGAVTIEFEDKNTAKSASEGMIALQYHSPGGFEVRFRNIRIKELD